MKELTNQISEQDLQIEELKQRLLDKDSVIKEHQQAIENARNELRKQKEKNAKMDDENFWVYTASSRQTSLEADKLGARSAFSFAKAVNDARRASRRRAGLGSDGRPARGGALLGLRSQ